MSSALPACQHKQEAGTLSHLGVFLVVVLLGADPAAHQVIPHRVRQGEVVIPRRRHVPVLHQSEVQVPVEALLDLGHISETSDTAHTDLLALLVVAQRLRHVGEKRGGGGTPRKVQRESETNSGRKSSRDRDALQPRSARHAPNVNYRRAMWEGLSARGALSLDSRPAF